MVFGSEYGMYVSCVFFKRYLGTSVIDSKLSTTQWTTGDTASSVSLMVRLANNKQTKKKLIFKFL